MTIVNVQRQTGPSPRHRAFDSFSDGVNWGWALLADADPGDSAWAYDDQTGVGWLGIVYPDGEVNGKVGGQVKGNLVVG